MDVSIINTTLAMQPHAHLSCGHETTPTKWQAGETSGFALANTSLINCQQTEYLNFSSTLLMLFTW